MRLAWFVLLCSACVVELGPYQEATPTPDDPIVEPPPPPPPSPCPEGMVLIEGDVPFCIDEVEAGLVAVLQDGTEVPFSPFSTIGGARVKAVSVIGQVPQGYISGEEAQSACEEAGKSLCALDQWLRACRGPNDTLYPYGDAHIDGACNETRAQHPVIEFFGSTNVFDSVHMNDPGINQQADTVDPGGSNTECVSTEGAYDLVGNLHEWIADPNGTFKGGFYVDAVLNGPGCTYQTTAHGFTYHDYSTGFRCCSEPGQ
jgi:sulfatase modifying factor 1